MSADSSTQYNFINYSDFYLKIIHGDICEVQEEYKKYFEFNSNMICDSMMKKGLLHCFKYFLDYFIDL